MTKKKIDENSFVFYRSFYDVVNLIPDEAMRCRAYTAICEYGFYGVEPAEDEDVLVRMVFTQAKPQIDANNKRRESASAGGIAKKKKMDEQKKANVVAMECHENAEGVPNMCREDANSVPNVNANVNENETANQNVNDNGNVKQITERFTPPTHAQVTDYIAEKGLQIDAERFLDYYTANGWMVGKNKMKDWKAALRHWARGDERNTAKGRNYDYNPRMKGGDQDGIRIGKMAPQIGLCL